MALTGMVLGAMPIGDYDKRLIILTNERGKITAFAKGARKQNSTLLASSQPLTLSEFKLYEGRNTYTVMEGNVINYFNELKKDLDIIYYAYYFSEFTEYFTRENNDEKETLKLLYQTFRALEKNTIDKILIRSIFELKIMAINGEYPQTFHCVKCSSTQKSNLFSFLGGGIICEECKKKANDVIRLNDSTIYTLQYIITSPIEKLYTFKVNDEVLYQLKKVMKRYLDIYVNKEFKSLGMIEMY